ncbi:hypothetical protein [Allorhodopirellula heiligendammensis]|uniref:Uncharacterized protein n=1 Tax=Allorhodopirellula heiligendammensis TaxID=2714739 RepID=A0A5C6BYK4_9BACT|nr:hypothetical protein [Allorhodopirellula heiligendammensis]TWU15699.1 hypothetical protein Poly21_28960 [Allorhodopirellula heiligendammensis]
MKSRKRNSISIVRLSVILAAVALTAVSGLALANSWVHSEAQTKATLTIQPEIDAGVYPSIHSLTINDRRNDPKIVVLHKTTRQLAQQRFSWVDLIAINPPDGSLECRIDGTKVELERQIQVFYAVDDQKPTKVHFSQATDIPWSPEAKWNALVR